MLGLVVHHSLPLVLLSFDFTLNCVPFAGRHVYGILAVCTSYILLNFIVTKAKGKPVYDMMGWDSLLGVLIPIMTLSVGLLFFKLLVKIS